MAVTPKQMRDTLRLWTSGVTIVTSTHGEERVGMTASAFNSLCLEPPLIVISVAKPSSAGRVIPESGAFAVSILAEDQAHLAERFAGRVPLAEGENRFDGVELTEATTGSPILAGALAWMDCTVHAIYDGVTHWIIVGEVQASSRRETEVAPLVYFNRDYRALDLPEPEPETVPSPATSNGHKSPRP